MQVKVKVDPLDVPFESKKKPGFFMRKCLVLQEGGVREVFTIGASSLAALMNLKTGAEITVELPGDFCFITE